MTRCTICHTRIADGDAVTRCSGCQQDYHSACWNELGGCGTYGCEQVAVAEKPAPAAIAGVGWGDTKRCPGCGAEIGSSLLKCGCGARFPYADPMSVLEYDEWKQEQAALSGAKRLIFGLFLGSLLGITAPVCGPIAGLYAHFNRERLAGESGTYLALGYGSGALGLAYGTIALLLAVGL